MLHLCINNNGIVNNKNKNDMKKTFNIKLAKTLYTIAAKQGDVAAMARIYDNAKVNGYDVDTTIKLR